MLNTHRTTAPGHRLSILLYAIVVLAFAMLIAGGALAQESQTEGEPSTSERQRLESLLQTLEDDGARAELIEQIRTLLDVTEPEEPAILPFLPQAESIGAQGLTYLSDQIGQVGNYGAAVVDAFVALPQIGDWIVGQLERTHTRDRWIDVAISLAIVIGVAVAVRLIAIWLIRPTRRVPDDGQERTIVSKLLLVGLAGLLDLIPLIAFLATAYIALGIIDPTTQVRLVALAVINASAITGLGAVIARLVLTPRRPHLRSLPLSDELATYFYLWFRRIAFTAVYGFFVAEAGQALGMPLAVRDALLVAVAAVVAIMVIIVILQNRAALAKQIRGPVSARPRSRSSRERQSTMQILQRRFADIWHLLAIVFVVINFTIFALDIEGGLIFMINGTILTAVTVGLAKLALRGLDRGLAFFVTKKSSLTGRYPALQKHWDFYAGLTNKIGKGLVLLVGTLALLDIWALGGFDWLATDFGSTALTSVVTIAIIILLAVFAWEVVGNAVERRLSETDEEGNVVEPTGRSRTLLPLLRNAFMIVLLTIVVLVILAEIGVNIAPLLAGAGVIGLAIGFGAQALVRDVITGLFILFEDWFNVGDVVDISGKVGVVEGLTIRTVQLRDLAGNVHMIQFGDVTTATNMTKEFSYAVVDIAVSYRENTDHVVSILSDIAESLSADTEFGPSILEPLEVLGVDNFTESSVVIRVRFKTAPIKQWWISREFRRRVKLRFDELGIELAIHQTRVSFSENQDGTASPARLTIERTGRDPHPAPPPPSPATGTADTAKAETPSTPDFEAELEEIDKEKDEADADAESQKDDETRR